jgi:hypothetical protein
VKAIGQDTYGSPDVLELRDIDPPVVNDDEVHPLRFGGAPTWQEFDRAANAPHAPRFGIWCRCVAGSHRHTAAVHQFARLTEPTDVRHAGR